MKAQLTAIAIMALMALSTPGTIADSAPGTESDAQCLLMGEPIQTVYGLLPEVITLDEDPRDVVCELNDGTILECEEIDNLYACVLGDDAISCEEQLCEAAVCVAEGGDMWICAGIRQPSVEDICIYLNNCQVPNPSENPEDCQVPYPCQQPEDCELPGLVETITGTVSATVTCVLMGYPGGNDFSCGNTPPPAGVVPISEGRLSGLATGTPHGESGAYQFNCSACNVAGGGSYDVTCASDGFPSDATISGSLSWREMAGAWTGSLLGGRVPFPPPIAAPLDDATATFPFSIEIVNRRFGDSSVGGIETPVELSIYRQSNERIATATDYLPGRLAYAVVAGETDQLGWPCDATHYAPVDVVLVFEMKIVK